MLYVSKKKNVYGPKEAIWNECEMLTRVVLRRIRNGNSFKRMRASKVMKCFQSLKESFNESLKKMFLNVLNVTSNRICDMLANYVMTFNVPIECISHGLCPRIYVL